MGAELQELLPSLSVTAAFAVCLAVVARREEAYTWWKAVAVVLAGAVAAVGTELLIGLAGNSALQSVLATLSLFAVVAAIALPARFWMLMSWRDAILVGVAYVLVQATISVALIYFQERAL